MSKHSRQAKKELVCAICNRGVGRALISGVTGAGMNWSLRVIKQIEILPKVASSRVCRHGIEETQPERFIDARNSYQVGFERNETRSNNGCRVRPELERRRWRALDSAALQL